MSVLMMRNRVLSLTRNVIPYVKELRELTDSVVGCILMQQLDYWFERYPNGFYKFLEPSDHPRYSSGQSWAEEIGISAIEFRTAFDKIGVRWKSKTEFEDAEDKFQGKFYASYQDKRSNVTFYFRNHELVDAALDDLLCRINVAGDDGGQSSSGFKLPVMASLKYSLSNQSPPGTEGSSVPGTNRSQSPVDDKQQAPEIGVLHLQELRNPSLDITEITSSEITAEKLPLPELLPTEHPDASSGLDIPENITGDLRSTLLKLVSELPQHQAQDVIDEVVGLGRVNAIRVSVVSVATGLVRKMKEGAFTLAAGVVIRQERELKARNSAAVKASNDAALHAVINLQPVSKSLPPEGKRISINERLARSGVVLSRQITSTIERC